MSKLAQRYMFSGSYRIDIGLTGNIGYLTITDNGLYPDEDSRTERRNLGYNTMMIPLMTREDLKDLKIAIKEVLKHSKCTKHGLIINLNGLQEKKIQETLKSFLDF